MRQIPEGGILTYDPHLLVPSTSGVEYLSHATWRHLICCRV